MMRVPKNYGNPFLEQYNTAFCRMREHRYIAELALAESFNLELKDKFLLDGKYLLPEYHVHHINVDKFDNRLKNLYITDKHEEMHKQLFSLLKQLMEDSFIGFKKGRHFLKE